MSTTLMAGSTGVGKTLLAAHFVAAGAARGEPSMLVSYSEPVARLVARAQGVSLMLKPLVQKGSLHLEYRPAVNIESDDLVQELLDKVRKYNIRRLVVDGIGDLELGVLQKERVRSLLSALIIQLRELRVTALFIKEVAKIAGPELDFSDTPISVTAENLLFFRHVELRGRVHRILSVLKMRESDYDPHVREFEITDRAVRVLGVLESAQGLLTGDTRPLPAALADVGRGSWRECWSPRMSPPC